jgi:hypothetical protein
VPQTRPNKITVPVNADAWNLAGDLATMADSVQTVIPVASQTERDSLALKNGLVVSRGDLGGLIEVCDGTSWHSPTKQRHAEWTNGGGYSVTGNQPWDIGPLSLTSVAFSNTFSNNSGTLSGQVNITETAVYALFLRLYNFSVNPGLSNAKLIGNGSTVWAEAVNQGGTGNGLWEWDVVRPNVYLTAGQTVRGTIKTTNSCTMTALLAITKVQG